ncbi:MAG TPA: pyridoxamine 5'-phosphate oxidase [Thermoleophilaceae bacterium]|nr:pyridoxamine 5'-phosphate oxidase [Thermoleophilaceae bacterium]
MTEDLEHMREDYEGPSLRRSDMASHWLQQLERWIDDAVRAQLPEPNAMVLATADVDAVPSVRTVLCKGLDEQGLTFFTNLRSRKGRELTANPRGAVVFPWIGLHRQAIVDGAIEPLDEAEADEYFASRPRGSQLGAVASAQSQPVESRAELEEAYREAEARYPDRVDRPEHWGGLRLRPDQVEFWQGRHDRLHDRVRYRHTVGEWVVERLAP